MRGGSKELIDLSIFYLEGKPDDTFRLKVVVLKDR